MPPLNPPLLIFVPKLPTYHCLVMLQATDRDNKVKNLNWSGRHRFLNKLSLTCCSILMRRANDWLRRNGHLKAKMCESIELKKRTGEDNIDTERVTFYEYGEYHNKFVRALRLAKLLFRYLHLVLCDLYF